MRILAEKLAVKVKGIWWWTLGMTQTLIAIRGLGNFMTEMCLYPYDLHRFMAFLRDGHLAQEEANNI